MITKTILLPEKGFTLLEMIIAISLIGTVIALAGGMLVESFSLFDRSSHRISTAQQAEMAVDNIASYLRSAVEIVDETSFRAHHNEYYDENDEDNDSEDNTVYFSFDVNPDNQQLIKNVYKDTNESDLLASRTIASNVEKFSIVPQNNGENYKIVIEYRTQEQNNSESPTSIKSKSVHPKNLGGG